MFSDKEFQSICRSQRKSTLTYLERKGVDIANEIFLEEVTTRLRHKLLVRQCEGRSQRIQNCHQEKKPPRSETEFVLVEVQG